ncbi:hypothetical protein [Pseudoalteromonas maricaloris]|nr:hypothetical protein [Pseudoalteromonas flavipulchra]MBE0373054.1 hypothetical protein [Pseudoalteromonas flavipulchra NCIMB 2033 = ATCC BAA-314]
MNSKSLDVKELKRVTGGNGGGGDGIVPPKAESRNSYNGGGGDGIIPPQA